MECKRCKGKGYVWVANGPDDVDRDICDHCDGEGWVKKYYCFKCKDATLFYEKKGELRCEECHSLLNEPEYTKEDMR